VKIFINCSNLISGGGLTVGLGVLRSIFNFQSDDEFIVFIPNTNDYLPFKSNQKIKLIRNLSSGYISKIFLEWKLSKIVKSENCDVILSLSNYAIPTNLPQSLLLHWPYAVYPEQEIWDNMTYVNKLKRKFRLLKLKYLLPYSNQLIVQTDVMKKRAQSYLVPKKNIVIISSAEGFMGDEKNKEITSIVDDLKEKGNEIFLCINEYYEHKNLEILIPLAQKIRKQNLKIKFIVTLNQSSFLDQIKDLEDVIINIGRVKRTETKKLFQSCNALFFPSLIESFGIPLVEAQKVGLPIYTSDRDFAHAVCGENAVYFNPNSIDDVLEKITTKKPLITTPELLNWDVILQKMLDTF